MQLEAKYKAIIFDLGGVMVSNWNTGHEFPRAVALATHVEQPVVEKALKECQSVWEKLEKGEIETPEFFKALWPKLNTQTQLTDALARDMVLQPLERAVEINENMLALAQGLRYTHKVGLLSNMIPDHVDFYLHYWPQLFEVFDAVMFSFDLGALKPDEQTFEKMMTKLGSHAEETIMVDNNPEIVEAANDAKLTGVLFTGYDTLRARLKELGLNVP